MRIGIDARALQHETQYRGIGKSLEFLLTAVSQELGAGESCVFYVDAALPPPNILTRFPGARVIHVAPSRIGRLRYVRSVLPPFRPIKPSLKDIDVLLQYDAALGIPTSVPVVTIFHDLIPFLFRGEEKRLPAPGLRKYKNALAGSMYWKKYLRVLKLYQHSTHIIAISESSRRDLLKYVPGIAKQNVTVIHHGVGSPLHSVQKPSKTAIELASQPYLLYVGGIDLRKNIASLITTLYELKPEFPKLRLVAVGKEFGLESQLQDVGWHTARDANPKYARDVITPGFVSDSDLAYLYGKAAAFVFTSRYEGFGLPPLEAMQAGCPTVTYDNSSLPEVVGSAAVVVKDGRSLAPAVAQILRSPQLRKELAAKGKKQAASFTWEKTARETLTVLRDTAQKAA